MAILLANLAQRVWYFDAVNGKDTASGLTSSDALKTLGEYVRRCGASRDVTRDQGFSSGTGVDLYFLTDMPESDRQMLSVRVCDPTLHFYIHGSNVLMLQGNLTAATASDPTTNHQATITHASFGASHVGKRVFFPNLGPGSWSLVIADLGGGVLQVTDPQSWTEDSESQTTRQVAGQTEAFQMLTCTTVYLASLTVGNYWAGGVTVWPPPVMVENIASPDSITFDGIGGFFQRSFVRQCQFTNVQALGGGATLFRACHVNCTVASGTVFGAQPEIETKFSACVFRGGVIGFRGATLGLHRQDANVLANFFSTVQQFIALEGSLVFRTAGSGAFSGMHLLGADFISTHNTDVLYTANQASGSRVFTLGRGAKYLYAAGSTIYAPSDITDFALEGVVSPTTAQPSLRDAAGDTVPDLATCIKWADVLAAPFNGRVYDFNTLCGIMPDSI